jgi:tetratricopeptide (TPR) repeat protein
MRQITAIVLLSGAIVLTILVFERSRTKPLASSQRTEANETYRAKKQPLPAPQADSGTAMPEPAQAPPPTNLLTRMARGEEIPHLRPEQLEAYLGANHRGVESLLGAYRTSRDRGLLQEAMGKYPKDPRVALEAAYFGAPEDRRKWLDAFKESAPDNALANYLSANDYLKAGDQAKALEELQAAAAKPNYQDYFGDFVQNATEAYRAAGYSEAEAKEAAGSNALLPQLASLKQVGVSLVDLAQSYQQSGDQASAQAALDMAMSLGARLAQPDAATIIQTLVGIAVEKRALGALDPASPFGSSGGTVQAALDALNQQREEIKTLTKPLDPSLLARLPEADVINFCDRQLLFGAQPAIQWLTSKYGLAGSSGQ